MFKSPVWATRLNASLALGIVEAVSPPRLAAYGLAASSGPDPVGAVARHARNIALSEAVYPVLHVLEVVMRNRIHDAFRSHFGATDWYLQPWLTPGHSKLVSEALTELAKHGKRPHPDRMIATLRFGFWCGMFHSAYENANGQWPQLLSQVLPCVPKNWRTRKKIQSRVEEARNLRNKVFHHEPILQLGDLILRHRRLIELIGWFSSEAREHVEHLCRFRSVFADHLVPHQVAQTC